GRRAPATRFLLRFTLEGPLYKSFQHQRVVTCQALSALRPSAPPALRRPVLVLASSLLSLRQERLKIGRTVAPASATRAQACPLQIPAAEPPSQRGTRRCHAAQAAPERARRSHATLPDILAVTGALPTPSSAVSRGQTGSRQVRAWWWPAPA